MVAPAGSVKICGIQGVSAIDFPGRIASVVFLGGCNFRCPFCHNPDLVLHADALPGIELRDALETIEQRRGLVDGVVVTGGEPLINGATTVLPLLRGLRDLGLAVKLDTNGYEVDSLDDVLASGLVDYVAMDVKTSPGKYAAAAGRTLEHSRVARAIESIAASGVPHEFRTTCVPGLVELEDVKTIASLLGPDESLVLQQFRPGHRVLDPVYGEIRPHSTETMERFADTARSLVCAVSLRGL